MKIQIWAGLCVFAIIIAGCGRAGSYFDQAETGTQESLSTEVSTQAGKLGRKKSVMSMSVGRLYSQGYISFLQKAAYTRPYRWRAGF